MERTASERAEAARQAWFMAKIRGDEWLRAAALADYREARREERARGVPTIVDRREASAFLSEWAL